MFRIKPKAGKKSESPGKLKKCTKNTWRRIKLEAPPALELFGEKNLGYLPVTLSNHSGEILDPEANKDLMFSFRLLDKHGNDCLLDAVRTPLTRSVPPGARHQQAVKIVIPRAELPEGAKIRVGMLLEGNYWLESINREHPCTVEISCNAALGKSDAPLAAARQIWEQGKGNGMRWPYGSMMVSERHKLFYIPVAKCACTSLKSMMVKLAGIRSPEVAIDLGIHLVADRFNTGVQLKDKPIERAREILASDQYFKFSVIRDPFERLVSAYLEKFVYQRTAKNNLTHTADVMRDVQGVEEINLVRGISFDQFVEYILDQDPYDLDPHWRPQHLYFLGVPHISRIFRLENIALLEQHLEQSLGVEVRLGHANATGKSDLLIPTASGLVAGELDNLGALDPDSFLSSKHAEALRGYYREDFEFYNRAGT